MKKVFRGFCLLALVFVFGICFTGLSYAEEEANEETSEETSESEEVQNANATSISISPVSNIVPLNPDSTYKDSVKVTNSGSSVMNFEVYAAPYSYVYSEDTDSYQLGFNKENNFTQIVRWIKIKDTDGNYVDRPKFSVPAGETLEVFYKIITPSSIPNGGQYAVIFAHTLADTTNSAAIVTEASPGLIIYGRSTGGETIVDSEISAMSISGKILKAPTGEATEPSTVNHINASAKVKNTGNVDFNAKGTLKVSGILFGGSYETEEARGRISVIPETELVVSDEWEETPLFGIFKVTWTVKAGDNTETIEKVVAINILPVTIILIILLTILTIWIIIRVRKRRVRRTRFAV